MLVAYRVYLRGVVQGVGFRAFTRKVAESYALDGWVRNLPDGRVEIWVQGDKDVVWQFLKEVSEGPRGARVDVMEIVKEVPQHEERGFSVRY
ncbi:acylphosphatase [Thermocrinis albus DSM 14484]|uniref:Acylphosphatase n=1 Tax=Thermocrinis albus (strain DSM 14484 / JCM 11386 / HI 11/12) TaxID=638303 RepID=D3SPJ2_THEAH|nr:acylphosphatase [Thermocrinis albus]ADC89079.1 acylphosphatase [Thermocrinis albus DSM 14484]